MTFEEVLKFDLNSENCFKCEGCPHNIGASDWQGVYPCGQWHCWVELSTRKEE